MGYGGLTGKFLFCGWKRWGLEYFDFVQIQINNNKTMTKTMTNLTKKVKLDIEDFFKNIGASQILLNNELHLQMLLAQHLQNKGYRIFYEYLVPASSLNGIYLRKNKNGNLQEMYIDLVVSDEKGKEYIPIELKYKTRKLNQTAVIFNKKQNGVDVLRDQGAQDLGRYGFWRDIYRLELVRNNYAAVRNGIALFVTNDPAYINNTNDPHVNYYDFHMKDGRTNVSGPLDWQNNNSKIAKAHLGFTLAGTYDIQWTPIGSHSNPRSRADFSYCLVVV